MARKIRIEVSYRPEYWDWAWIPPCYRAELVGGGRPDRLPYQDGETEEEAVRFLCELHGLDPSRVEIVRRD